MAGLQVLLALLAMPAVAWVLALLAVQTARDEVERQELPRNAPGGPSSKILVHYSVSAAPIVFGFVLFALARPALDRIDSGAFPALEPLIVWGSFAYAIAAYSTIAAQSWIVRARLRSFLGSEFGRALPLVAIPMTAVLFALVLMFFLLGYVGSVTMGGPAASDSALAAAVSSFQAFAVSTLAFPVAAGSRIECPT